MKVRGLRVLRGLSYPYVWELAVTPMGSGPQVAPQTLQTPQGYSREQAERDAGLDPLDASPSTRHVSHARAREQAGSSSTCLCTRADYACSSPLCPGRRLLGEQGSGVSPAPIAAKSRGVADDVSLPRHRPLYGTYCGGGAGEPAAGQHVALVASSARLLPAAGEAPRGAARGVLGSLGSSGFRGPNTRLVTPGQRSEGAAAPPGLPERVHVSLQSEVLADEFLSVSPWHRWRSDCANLCRAVLGRVGTSEPSHSWELTGYGWNDQCRREAHVPDVPRCR